MTGIAADYGLLIAATKLQQREKERNPRLPATRYPFSVHEEAQTSPSAKAREKQECRKETKKKETAKIA